MAYISGEPLISIGKLTLIILVINLNILSAREIRPGTFFGVSQVFKTQIYESPDLKSKVIGYLDKGEKVKVHPKHFKEAEIRKKIMDQKIDFYDEKQGFYQIITDRGLTGHIEKAHIHLIYRDFRDQHYHFEINPEEDLTDYRLNEPLSSNYPLAKKVSYRLSLQARLGPGFVDNFVFPKLIKKERFSNRYGAALTFLKNAEFDFEDRFYFGGVIKFLTFRNEFTLVDDAEYLEDHLGVTIGPTLYYESLRLKGVTIGHGIELNFIYRLVHIDGRLGNIRENRKFDGYIIEPALVNQISFQNKKKNLDFNIGMRISARPKYQLKSSKPSDLDDLWGDRDGFYELEAKVYQTYFMGIQVYY